MFFYDYNHQMPCFHFGIRTLFIPQYLHRNWKINKIWNNIFNLLYKTKYNELGENWKNERPKTRVLDKNFKEQVENDRVYTCEKRFREEKILICKQRTLGMR